MKRELLYGILKLSLSDDRVGYDIFKDVSAEDWNWVFHTLSMHGLSAFAYNVVEDMPAEVRPPKEVLLKFIAADMSAKKSYVKLKGLVEKIGDHVTAAGIRCLLLKGLSLSQYYKRPECRKFVDIDLYAPDAGSEVDDVFRNGGIVVDNAFYRHSHINLSGVLVENHHCLLDVRGRDKLVELDADLKDMALSHLNRCPAPGIYYPDTYFSLIFNLHHALSHFIYEGISFKFLVDWVLFLRKEHLTTDQNVAYLLEKHGLLKFAAVMSEVCVKYFGLDLDDVPQCIRTEMLSLKPRVVDRFVSDLFRPYEKVHHSSLVSERLHSVRRIARSAWKPKEFLGQSAVGFVWDKFIPILMGRKFEAD